MKSFLKNNIGFIIYFLFAIIVELSSVFVMNNKFYIILRTLALNSNETADYSSIMISKRASI